VRRRLLLLLCAASASGALRAAEPPMALPGATAAASAASESEAQRTKRLMACLHHTEGVKQLEYPDALRRRGAQGRVVARLRFTAADQPPEVELLHRPAAREFQFFVDDHVRKLRLPCHDGAAFRLQQLYVFKIEGSKFGFRPGLGFEELLQHARTRTPQTVVLDTSTMGCPFHIRYFYLQPSGRNGVWVDEPGPTLPSRRPLLDALADSELTLVGSSLSAVYADTARLQVPCGRFELKPSDG
jgi:hypothetical protein